MTIYINSTVSKCFMSKVICCNSGTAFLIIEMILVSIKSTCPTALTGWLNRLEQSAIHQKGCGFNSRLGHTSFAAQSLVWVHMGGNLLMFVSLSKRLVKRLFKY